jgi:hypothetical protein
MAGWVTGDLCVVQVGAQCAYIDKDYLTLALRKIIYLSKYLRSAKCVMCKLGRCAKKEADFPAVVRMTVVLITFSFT